MDSTQCEAPGPTCPLPALVGARYCVNHSNPVAWPNQCLPRCLCGLCEGTPDAGAVLCSTCFGNFRAAADLPGGRLTIASWLADLAQPGFSADPEAMEPDSDPGDFAFELALLSPNAFSRLVLDAILRPRARLIRHDGKVFLRAIDLMRALGQPRAFRIQMHANAQVIEIAMEGAKPGVAPDDSPEQCEGCSQASSPEFPLLPVSAPTQVRFRWLCLSCAKKLPPAGAPK